MTTTTPRDLGDELVLAIDCGTQSVRALLFDARGELVVKAQQPLTDYRSPQEGWLEHDAERFWEAAAGVCRRAASQVTAGRIRGVVVTTQRGTLVPVDAQGRALRPFIVWLDQRQSARRRRFSPWWSLGFKAARVTDTIESFVRDAEMNWIAEHEPKILAATHKVLLLSGWLHWKLTGRMADSVGNQVAYLPFDFKGQRWAPGWDWKWQAIEVQRAQLPELVPVGETLGTLSAEAAAATGLPAGLPVLAAAADKACEIAGAGAATPEIGAISYGTTATIDITTPRYCEAIPFVPPYPALLPGQYNTELQIFRGLWLVSWFKEQFGQPERAEAERDGVAAETLFDRMVAHIPPGSQGLVLQPTWTPGIRHPGPDARGAIIGFTDVHTRAHLYRAILEGLAYALREGKETIERRSKQPIRELRVSGGGSQSDTAMQITADVFGLPTSRPHTYETSGLGAAIAGAVGLGLHRDFPGAVAAMTRLARTFEPGRDAAARYDALYREVYRPMYARLEPLYGAIRRIVRA